MKNKILQSFVALGFTIILMCVLLSGCGGNRIEVSADPVKKVANERKPELKVFLENSGSMDGYMCAGSQLKNAVFDYVSELKNYTGATKLYYINSRIISYNGALEQYIKTLNPATFKAAGGDRSNSDMSAIISKVLEQVNDSTVCLFISDCILDLPVSDSQKYLTECEISIRNSVNDARRRVPALGVEILKMSSDFSGTYFYPDGTTEKLTNVKRPYYIWIFGNSELIGNLNREVPLTELKNRGLEECAVYSGYADVAFEVGNKTGTSQVINPEGGNYIMTVKADLNPTLQPASVVNNPASYSFFSPFVKVMKVTPITASGSRYTHLITLSIPQTLKTVEECLSLKAPGIPAWVESSNDLSGKDVSGNISRTTGIKQLVEGVSEAYKKEKTATNMKFKIKR